MNTTTQKQYKQTEIGEIPKDWEIKKIKDISEVVGGGTPSTKNPENFGGEIPWITPKDLSGYQSRYISHGERSLSKQGLEHSSAKVLPTNTVLLSSRAPVGYATIAARPMSTNQGFRSMIPQAGTVPEYLYYLVKNNTSTFEAHASGSTFKELSGSTLENLKFPIAPHLQQQQIASILSSLDDKIELNRKMNKILEEVGKALFKQWFVDDTEQSQQIELQSIVEFNPREVLSKGQTATYLEMKDLPEQGMWVYSEVQKAYGGGTKFKNGDTLMARITPCLENGKSGFVNFLESDEVAFGSTEYIVLRPKNASYKEFVYYLVRDEEFREFAIRSMVGSSGRQRVQTDAIKNYQLSNPTSDKIEKFHSLVQPIFEHIKFNAIESEKLSAIKNSLLPRLMSGKLRVN